MRPTAATRPPAHAPTRRRRETPLRAAPDASGSADRACRSPLRRAGRSPRARLPVRARRTRHGPRRATGRSCGARPHAGAAGWRSPNRSRSSSSWKTPLQTGGCLHIVAEAASVSAVVTVLLPVTSGGSPRRSREGMPPVETLSAPRPKTGLDTTSGVRAPQRHPRRDVPRARDGRRRRLDARQRPPPSRGGSRRQPVAAAVDRRRLRAHARGVPASGRRARRPLRAAPRADHRPGRVRHRVGARGDGRRRVRAHRLPRADGNRRRADHARHAVDDHQRLPTRRASEGSRDLGRFRRHGRNARAPRFGSAARRLLLGFDLPRHRRPRARRTRRRRAGRAVHQVVRARRPRPHRFGALRPRHRAPRARDHRGTRAGLDQSVDARRARRRRRAHHARSFASSCGARRRCSTRASSGGAGFATGSASLFLQFFAMFGFFFVSLQFLQLVLGYSALDCGGRAPADVGGHPAVVGRRRNVVGTVRPQARRWRRARGVGRRFRDVRHARHRERLLAVPRRHRS